MKSKVRFKGQMLSFMRWPVILSVVLVLMNVIMYFISVQAGLCMTLFLLIYLTAASVIYYYYRKRIYNHLITFATQYGQIQRKLWKGDLVQPGIFQIG